eukprot:TRINITY_DN18463_c0_g1_i1.p1 TRINITY_DN18463_c0_g1~~TRINITY_DN18463_c0_g1_i1.p1  ORF type:complete len:461 (+),score=101.26 TRINITY_DN18463_c0_g1_i1:159-1385(+)
MQSLLEQQMSAAGAAAAAASAANAVIASLARSFDLQATSPSADAVAAPAANGTTGAAKTLPIEDVASSWLLGDGTQGAATPADGCHSALPPGFGRRTEASHQGDSDSRGEPPKEATESEAARSAIGDVGATPGEKVVAGDTPSDDKEDAGRNLGRKLLETCLGRGAKEKEVNPNQVLWNLLSGSNTEAPFEPTEAGRHLLSMLTIPKGGSDSEVPKKTDTESLPHSQQEPHKRDGIGRKMSTSAVQNTVDKRSAGDRVESWNEPGEEEEEEEEADTGATPKTLKHRRQKQQEQQQQEKQTPRPRRKGRKKKQGENEEEESPSVDCISGDWWGDRGESYTVDAEAWLCFRYRGGTRVRFTLTWDETWSVVIWGRSYYFDPEDVKANPNEVAWYSIQDHEKKRKMFVWSR